MRRLLPVFALLTLSSCDTRDTLVQPETNEIPPPSLAIVDGLDPGGDPFFHWQPPIAQNLYRATGVFAEDLHEHLIVEICEWNGTSCKGAPVKTFTSEGEAFSVIRMFPELKVFSAIWKTWREGLNPEATYRLFVKARGIELGFADVDLVERICQIYGVDRQEYVPLLNNFALPIVFTVEEGAAQLEPNVWHVVDHGSTMAAGFSVWGSSGNDVFIGGGHHSMSGPGVMLHFDGNRWEEQELPPNTPTIVSIWGLSQNEVYALADPNGPWGVTRILRYDGSSWGVFHDPILPGFYALTNIWGTASDNIFVSTGHGIYHFDGSQWTESEPDRDWTWIAAVHGSPDGTIMAAGSIGPDPRKGYFLELLEEGWVRQEERSADVLPVDPLYVVSGDLAYAAAYWQLLRWDGLGWEVLGGSGLEHVGLWVLPEGEVLGVGNGGANCPVCPGVSWFRNGGIEQAEGIGELAGRFYAVWATADGSEVFAVGEAGTYGPEPDLSLIIAHMTIR